MQMTCYCCYQQIDMLCGYVSVGSDKIGREYFCHQCTETILMDFIVKKENV